MVVGVDDEDTVRGGEEDDEEEVEDIEGDCGDKGPLLPSFIAVTSL